MRKLFKKSLACLLAAIFCVTLCVAAVPASAEAITYSTNDVVAKAGETVTIDFAVSNFIKVKGAMIKFFLPDAVASVEDVKLNGAEIAAYDAETGAGYYKVEDNAIKFLSLFGYEGELAAVETLTFNVTVKVAEDAAEGAYTYADPYFSVTEDGETLADVTGAFGTFEVKNAPAVVEPVLDANLAIYKRSASVQDTLGIGYVIMNNTFAAYDHIAIEIVAQKYNGDFNVATAEAIEIPVSKLNAALSTATYTGIAMYELDLNVTATVKAYDAEGNYVAYSNAYTDTPLALLKDTYNTSSSTAFKTVVTDMLNLGTAAQKYFGSNSANASNELLVKFNSNPINKDFDQTYASEEMPELTLANSITWAENSPLTSADVTFRPSVNFAGTPTLGYIIMDTKDQFDVNDIKLDVSYTAVYPTSFAGLKEASFTGEAFVAPSTKVTTATFNKMTLTDSNQIITAKLYYKDQLVLTSTYTVDQGIASATAGAKDLANALAKFEAAARTYFAN